MNIEKLVQKHLDANWYGKEHTGYADVAAATASALTEQANEHAIEMRAYEATVQNLEQRIRELEAQRVPDVRCKCCGYLVTESEHKGCLRAADATAPEGWKLVPDTLEDCGISCGYSPSVNGECVPFVTIYMPEMNINDEAGWDRRNKIADALSPIPAAPKKEVK